MQIFHIQQEHKHAIYTLFSPALLQSSTSENISGSLQIFLRLHLVWEKLWAVAEEWPLAKAAVRALAEALAWALSSSSLKASSYKDVKVMWALPWILDTNSSTFILVVSA